MSETAREHSGFSIDRGPNGGLITFVTREELIEYFRQEMNHFQWLNGTAVTERFSYGHNLAAHQRNFFANWYSAASDIRNRPDPVIRQQLDQASLQLASYVALSKDSPDARFIEELQERRGPIVAAGAFMSLIPLLQLPPQGQIRSEVSHGMFLGYQFREHLSNKSISAQKAFFTKTTEESRQELAELKQKNAEAEKMNSWLTKKVAKRIRAIGRISRNTSNKWAKANAAIVKDAVDRIDQTNSTYKQFMQLKAPVKYWEKKADGHLTRAVISGIICVIYAGCVMLAFINLATKGVFLFAPLLETKDGLPSPTALLLGALGFSILTIIFWIGRIFVRIYLSEHHLAIDARFRATMVQTYLALTNEGVATESDRNIILAAIFRPTGDGIVKDDAAPFMSLPSALSSKLSP